MAYPQRYRRRRYRSASRPASRGTPGTFRQFRRASGRDIPSYSYVRGSCKKLVHLWPITPGLVQLTASNVSTAATSFHLNQFVRGDGLDMRHANKTLVRYLYMRCNVYTNTYTVTSSFLTNARMVVVWDRECRGLAPVFTDIFDSYSTTAFPRVEFRERFQILYDRNFDGGTPTISVWNGSNFQLGFHKMFNIKIPVDRMTVWAPSSTGGAVSDIEKGSLYVFFIAPSAYGATSHLTLSFIPKVTFDDYE